MTDTIVHTDNRGRAALGKYLEPSRLYRADKFKDGTVTLTPVTVYTREELDAEIGEEAANQVFDTDPEIR